MNPFKISSEPIRIFGDSEITIKVGGGNVVVNYNSLKAMRLIEKMMVGRRYDEPPYLASRVCGACSQAHFWASNLAVESALGIEVPEDAAELRDICNKIQTVQNLIAHLAVMAVPDYANEEVQKKALSMALKLNTPIVKALDLVGGRLTNPNLYSPGGFKDVSTLHVKKAYEMLKSVKDGVNDFVELCLTLKLPEMREPNSTYLTLEKAPMETVPKTSEFKVKVSNGEEFKGSEYKKLLQEIQTDNSTSKKCFYKGSAFYVGTRARLLNLKKIKNVEIPSEIYKAMQYNPFANIHAKALETKIMLEDLLLSLENMLDRNLKLRSNFKPKPATGVGIVEAPRGLVVHCYTINKDLKVVDADIITPTVMNTAHFEKSAEELLKNILTSGGEEKIYGIVKLIEALARTYDPCLACATHVIRMEG
ncbi:MAG: nickel-dependent hydrogenase large subunit [Archaeoglobaceae archaeon]